MSTPRPNPIAEALAGAVQRYGDRPALACGKRSWSYAELGQAVERSAERLSAALPPAPAHLGFYLANSAEYVITYFAAQRAGHLPFLLDAHFNVRELEVLRDDCALGALVLDTSKLDDLELPHRGPPTDLGDGLGLVFPERGDGPSYPPRPDTRLCRFTSGTTGKPKCLEFSGQAVVAAARNWVTGTAMGPDDRTLCLAALSNGLAFNTSLLSTFLAGAELCLYRGFPLTRAISRLIARRAITRLVAFPTLYRHFVAPGGPEPATLASLGHAISAGAPLWPDVRQEFRQLYGLDISDYYGIAETGPCTFEPEAEVHAGLGKPLPGVTLRIAPGAPGGEGHDDDGEGEILVRSESMASGYLNHPGHFEARLDGDQFYHSGDRGRIAHGRLHLTGRTEDHINVGGRKVDPTEILAVVLATVGVGDAVVFPDHDLHRETVAHLVVVRAAPDLTRQGLIAACGDRLASYKIPGRISFVEEIPRNGIGKPRLAALREQLSSTAESATGSAT